MSDEEYARERLGIFPDTDDEPQWLVVTEAQYLACAPKLADGTPLPADAAGWLQTPIALAVELTQDRETITVVAAGQTTDGPGAHCLIGGHSQAINRLGLVDRRLAHRRLDTRAQG